MDRQHAPAAARARQIADRIQDLAQIHLGLAPAPRRFGQQWRDALPFRIGQITRITPSLKRRLSLTVLFRPHPPYVAQRPPLSEPMPYSQTGSKARGAWRERWIGCGTGLNRCRITGR